MYIRGVGIRNRKMNIITWILNVKNGIKNIEMKIKIDKLRPLWYDVIIVYLLKFGGKI